MIATLRIALDSLRDRNELLEQALYEIAQWSRAYPLEVFPEPDMAKAAELLRAGNISLDAVAASCMRHVVEGVGKIASDALIKHRKVRNKKIPEPKPTEGTK